MTAMSKWIGRGTLLTLGLLAAGAAGCGDYVRQGRGPVIATVAMMEAASGADPDEYGGTLSSDVITYVKKTIGGVEVRVPTIFNDLGRATIMVDMKSPSETGPTSVNQVTFTRYRVEFIRSDGRNTPGVDVPYAFDSAVTVTSAPGSTATAGFELVRNSAKTEKPLVALVNNLQLVSTIARVTFYGKDHAGNDVTAVGQIGITFGDFGDPD
jgi:hypothetical protein